MAGDWIPMRIELHEDPAVIGIALATRLDEFSVVGRLHRFWGWANQQTQDGVVPFVIPEKVDQIVGREGFASAMVKVGWLMVTPEGGIKVPSFNRWMSEPAKKRLADSRRKAEERRLEALSEVSPKSVQKKSDKNGSPVLYCPELIPPKQGGLGEDAPDPPNFEETPEGLAQAWCFLATRCWGKGVKRDLPEGMVRDFAELIRIGHSGKSMLADLLDPKRDRGEQFFEFRNRIKASVEIASQRSQSDASWQKAKARAAELDKLRAENGRI
jgi:hypothetical protein